MLCKYRDLFGKPNKGLHRFRIFNIAIVDVLLTLLLAYVLKTYTFKKTHYGIISGFCFITGIIAHRLFCVKTTIDKLLF